MENQEHQLFLHSKKDTEIRLLILAVGALLADNPSAVERLKPIIEGYRNIAGDNRQFIDSFIKAALPPEHQF